MEKQASIIERCVFSLYRQLSYPLKFRGILSVTIKFSTKGNTMKKDYTHICIVLDASGSMNPIKNDIKGSFNSFLDKQREVPGKTVFDLYQFADESEHIVKAANLAEFHEDLMEKYKCSGCTALYDSVCEAIDELGTTLASMPEEERPENVMFVIITDGMENASRSFSHKDVKKRIEHQKKKYNWDFTFLAANIDTDKVGISLGICEQDCLDFTSTEDGASDLNKIMSLKAQMNRSRGKARNVCCSDLNKIKMQMRQKKERHEKGKTANSK